MGIATVQIQFEADTPEEAQSKIEALKLPEGTKVWASMNHEVGPPGVNEINAKGKMIEPLPEPMPTPEEE